MTSSALAALLAAVALWGPASGAGPALVRFQEVAASFKPATGTPSGFATLGTYHSCKWSGAPDRLEDFLLASQMQDPAQYYYGRDRRRDYFQHLFVDKECEGGLPKGHCLSSLRTSQHCGDPQNFAVIAPDERDGPGVMWNNKEPCLRTASEIRNATVAADFFCPREGEDVHLHMCVWEGEPDAVPPAAVQDINGGDAAAKKGGATGYYEHHWAPEDCVNGLPPAATADSPVPCVASLRWMEHCGDEHDWQAFAPGEDGKGTGVRWYTSHTCEKARVAVDYFCAKGPSGVEFTKRVHRCRYRGRADKAADQQRCRREHRSSPRPAAGTRAGSSDPGAAGGACMEHRFSSTECYNGLPQGKCMAAVHTFRECGSEQGIKLDAPQDLMAAEDRGDSKKLLLANGAAASWYNANEGGPCGEAEIVADYYCFSQCTRNCANGGALREDSCTCDCRASDPGSLWTGPECGVCGGEDSDCPRGKALDRQSCSCK